jgi:leucyl aminopeptidase
MQTLLPSDSTVASLPLWLAPRPRVSLTLLQSLPPSQAAWARAQAYAAERHRLLLLPAADGALAGALWGLGALRAADELSLWDAAPLPERLPAGNFRLGCALAAQSGTQFALGWLLGSYRLSRYRGTAPKPPAVNALVTPHGADAAMPRRRRRPWALDAT